MPKSSAAMYVLAPDDFKTAGIARAGEPKPNISDGGASAYCVYDGESSATGGIELDVFFPSEADTKTNASEGLTLAAIKLAGADSDRTRLRRGVVAVDRQARHSGGVFLAELRLGIELGIPCRTVVAGIRTRGRCHREQACEHETAHAAA